MLSQSTVSKLNELIYWYGVASLMAGAMIAVYVASDFVAEWWERLKTRPARLDNFKTKQPKEN